VWHPLGVARRSIAPLTGQGVVERIITDLAVIDVTRDGLELVELAPTVTLEDVRAKTGPDFAVRT
jgi:3-oxoacid CoA-transferase subunit B